MAELVSADSGIYARCPDDPVVVEPLARAEVAGLLQPESTLSWSASKIYVVLFSNGHL